MTRSTTLSHAHSSSIKLHLRHQRVIEFLKFHHKSVTCVYDSLGRSYLSSCLNLNSAKLDVKFGSYLNLDRLLEWMRLLVACEPDSLIQQKLVPDRVTQSVVFTNHNNCSLMSLSTILLVLDLP